jgi:hypothetical protein
MRSGDEQSHLARVQSRYSAADTLKPEHHHIHGYGLVAPLPAHVWLLPTSRDS